MLWKKLNGNNKECSDERQNEWELGIHYYYYSLLVVDREHSKARRKKMKNEKRKSIDVVKKISPSSIVITKIAIKIGGNTNSMDHEWKVVDKAINRIRKIQKSDMEIMSKSVVCSMYFMYIEQERYWTEKENENKISWKWKWKFLWDFEISKDTRKLENIELKMFSTESNERKKKQKCMYVGMVSQV